MKSRPKKITRCALCGTHHVRGSRNPRQDRTQYGLIESMCSLCLFDGIPKIALCFPLLDGGYLPLGVFYKLEEDPAGEAPEPDAVPTRNRRRNSMPSDVMMLDSAKDALAVSYRCVGFFDRSEKRLHPRLVRFMGANKN